MIQLLSSSNWVMYNASIARALGKDCAILLGELCSMKNAFNKEEFFVSYERIEERTALNEREIRKAMNILIKCGIIKRKQNINQGNKWFYKIIEAAIVDTLKDGKYNEKYTTYGEECVSECTHEGVKNDTHEGAENDRHEGSHFDRHEGVKKRTPIYMNINHKNNHKNNQEELVEKWNKFDEFWKEYPVKIKKAKAKELFLKIHIDEYEKIMKALQSQKTSAQWTKDEGKFIPHPTTWLSGEYYNLNTPTHGSNKRYFEKGKDYDLDLSVR